MRLRTRIAQRVDWQEREAQLLALTGSHERSIAILDGAIDLVRQGFKPEELSAVATYAQIALVKRRGNCPACHGEFGRHFDGCEMTP